MVNESVNQIKYSNVVIVLWRNRYRVIGSALICGIIALIVSFFIPKTYEAKATLLIMPPKFQTDVQPTAFSAPTYEGLLESRELVKEIINQLGLQNTTVEELQKKMTTKLIMESQPKALFTPVIHLMVRSNNPMTAAAIANKWTELFVARTEHLSSQEIDKSYQLLTTQLDSTKQNLFQAEETLKRYREKYKLENLRSELASKLQQLDGSYAPVLFRTPTPSIVSVYPTSEAQKLEQGYHSLYASLVFEMNTTKNLLEKYDNQLSADEKSRLQSRIDAIAIEVSELSKTIRQLEDDAKQLQNESVIGDTLIGRAQREVDTYKITYNLLSEKAEQAKIAKAEQVEDVKIFAKAIVPEQHVWPRKSIITIIATLVGFMISTGIVLLQDYLKKAI